MTLTETVKGLIMLEEEEEEEFRRRKRKESLAAATEIEEGWQKRGDGELDVWERGGCVGTGGGFLQGLALVGLWEKE